MTARTTTGGPSGGLGGGRGGGREETIGLLLAIALHVAVVAALLYSRHAPPPKAPDRVVVTLSDDVGLKSTSPNPAAKTAADVAPTIGEAPPAPAEPVPVPPAPVQEQAPPPPPKPVPQPRPEPHAVVQPAPAPKPAPPRKAATPPQPVAHEKPTPPHKATAAAQAAEHAAPTQKPTNKHAGGQRIGADFLKGLGSDPGTSHDSPAAAIGPGVTASLASAISRQLKPNWTAPDGVDVDKLSTTIEWDMNADGTLAGTPRFVSQTGVTASNRAQAQRHVEQAMRAVRQSAPFPLPPKYYAAWKRVRFTFDWKLDQ